MLSEEVLTAIASVISAVIIVVGLVQRNVAKNGREKKEQEREQEKNRDDHLVIDIMTSGNVVLHVRVSHELPYREFIKHLEMSNLAIEGVLTAMQPRED